MIKQVKEMSTVGFLLIVSVAILVAIGLVFAFIYTIAIDIKNTATNTNNVADAIAEVFFRQNRTAIIVSEVRQVQDELVEFETTSEENRQALVNVLVPALQRSFNQTDRIDALVTNLSETEKRIDENLIKLTTLENQTLQEQADAVTLFTELLSQNNEMLRNISEAVDNLPKGDTNFN